ncbi:MAG: hypothetical protein PHQ23_14450 [Candidatus Wallbacteria bacterium]|nr:hypothetical protein [Candidatus Wallbacteria bacterium]
MKKSMMICAVLFSFALYAAQEAVPTYRCLTVVSVSEEKKDTGSMQELAFDGHLTPDYTCIEELAAELPVIAAQARNKTCTLTARFAPCPEGETRVTVRQFIFSSIALSGDEKRSEDFARGIVESLTGLGSEFVDSLHEQNGGICAAVIAAAHKQLGTDADLAEYGVQAGKIMDQVLGGVIRPYGTFQQGYSIGASMSEGDYAQVAYKGSCLLRTLILAYGSN